MGYLAHRMPAPCFDLVLVVLLCVQHAAAATSLLSITQKKIPGVWLLAHPNARCNLHECKDLGSGNILACQNRALADNDCGSEITSNGFSCHCVRIGKRCHIEPGIAFSVYEFRRSATPRGHVAVGDDALSCLKAYAVGCQKVQQEVGCLSGREGQSPCVWCGGRPCRNSGGFLCESLDGLGSLGSSEQPPISGVGYSVAACDGDTPRPVKLQLPLPSRPRAHAPVVAQSLSEGEGRSSAQADHLLLLPQRPEVTGCLEFHSKGCFSILDRDTCVNRRDGQSTSAWNGVTIHGEPCVWCGESCVWACEPFEYFMQGEGKTFASIGALTNLTVANCKDGVSRPTTMQELVGPASGSSATGPWWLPQRPSTDDMQCLTSQSGGCSGIGDLGSCLSSRDGSGASHGDPCVWCGGESCSAGVSDSGTGGSLCEAYRKVSTQREGPALRSRAFPRVASCEAAEQVPLPPHSCLQSHAKGCQAISSKDVCLNSMDGSGVDTVEGLKVRGQPCVWCGGGACHTGRLSFCEPFDYLVNGEGKAFIAFTAKLTSSLAACKGSEPHPAWLASWLAPKWPHLASPRFVEGSECVNFPPCVEIGLKFGSCCPDFAGEMLSCCSPRPAPQRLAVSPLPAGVPSEPLHARSDASNSESSTLQAPPSGQHPVAAAEHLGEDCWWECNEKSGYCDWCGASNACCSSGDSSEPAECAGAAELVTALHECIATTPSKRASVGVPAAAVRVPGADTKSSSAHDNATTWQPASLSANKGASSVLVGTAADKSLEAGVAKSGVQGSPLSPTEDAKAKQIGGNVRCPWWVGALLLLACMASIAWVMGLHRPYIESCNVVRQHMPLLKSEGSNCSQCGCGVDTEGSEEDDIEEKRYRRRAVPKEHMLGKYVNGPVASRGTTSALSRSNSSNSRQTHRSIAVASVQEQYDLVMITPDGPKVLSLQGSPVPPGIPVAHQPYDLITVKPQEDPPRRSFTSTSDGTPDSPPPSQQLSATPQPPFTPGSMSRLPSMDGGEFGMPAVRVDSRPHPSPHSLPRHIPEGPLVMR